MHIFRHTDRTAFRHEVLLERPERGVHDAEAEALGVVLHRPKTRLSRLGYMRALNALLQQRTYDIVHSHMYLFTGFLLGTAKRHGVPVRIAHAHQASITQGDVTKWQAFKHRIFLRLLDRNATKLIGISEDAIEEIAGQGWRTNDKASVLIYGFDFQPFAEAHERGREVRTRFNLKDHQLVIGHVGRFVRQKNHELLVNSFAEVARERQDVRLLLVGEGPLVEDVRAQVRVLELQDKVVFAGTTTDIPAFMAAFDLFVLTSRHEGLGIVAVEAQAAGTPCIFSDVVPPEADVLTSIITRLPADDEPKRWAEEINARLSEPATELQAAWRLLESSRYGIKRCVAELEAIYSNVS
jgi:glycosyltransferase involved in cell wall biosynthesis